MYGNLDPTQNGNVLLLLATRLLVYYIVSLCVAVVSSSPQIELYKSTVVGRDITELNVDFLGGIPYAKPPLGPLRLPPPVVKPYLDAGVFNASSFGLTHGGGYQTGSASSFNGSALVFQSVQRDQLAALEWVQHNIGAFGGDKDKARLSVIIVTLFGESAGFMTAVLFLNPSVSKVARAAIFESGSASSTLTFGAQHREDSWTNFVEGVPSCSSLVGTSLTVDCLQSTNSSDVLQGLLQAMAETDEQLPFDPTLDGTDGNFPDLPSRLLSRRQFARLPFIAGTNLDEGTLFCPTELNYTNELLLENLNANFSPPAVPPNVLGDFLTLYPDDPAAGSPFNTGNDTFGLSPLNKKCAALRGHLMFDSQRRLWIQTTSEAGVKAFGYRFTQPLSTTPTYLGGSVNETATAKSLSVMMMDYWVSFATSLNPNDGLGSERPLWPQYMPNQQVLLQLNGDNLTIIPDDYNKEKIDFIISEVEALLTHSDRWTRRAMGYERVYSAVLGIIEIPGKIQFATNTCFR
ncbi:extracellular triacylglycerol lipase precursor [Armillaria novae-zelandiae]|uniref:Extracellular triacylglycerol lipase n=1 Tax=Armillaria novae-zelandiae TaxID=153914 RepID=A0AA39PJT6_9AGAR|nr:extracellular triacylglycerol lipase precursor [Armillaria novae-zelandiae]